MKEDENFEAVEAMPGPTIIITKETYEKMQKQDNTEETFRLLEKYKPFFEKVNKN